jgi:hypothetical protein
MNTGMDDQLARCKVAEEEGWGIVIENRTKSTIISGIQKLWEIPRQESFLTENEQLSYEWLSKLK